MRSREEGLEELYEDGEPIGPNYIFGDTAEDESDLYPNVQRPTVRRSFRRVSSNAQLKKVMVGVSKATNKRTKKKNPLPFAAPASVDPAANLKEKKWDSHTYTEIPDGDAPLRHPLFGINPDIVTDEEYSPERDAESRIPIENLVSYEKEDIDRIEKKSKSITKDIQRKLLEEGAALLISYDDASSFVEAVMKDGLGINIEIDSSVSEAISQMLRLNMISAYMDQMSMPAEVKRRFMRILTEKIAEDTHGAIQKQITTDKYNTVLKNLQARMKSSPGTAAADLSSQLGVVRKRSGRVSGGLDQNFGDGTDDQHSFNELQNAGVRLEGN